MLQAGWTKLQLQSMSYKQKIVTKCKIGVQEDPPHQNPTQKLNNFQRNHLSLPRNGGARKLLSPWVLNVHHQNPTQKLNSSQRNRLSMSAVVKFPLQVTPNRNITVTISCRHHTTVRAKDIKQCDALTQWPWQEWGGKEHMHINNKGI